MVGILEKVLKVLRKSFFLLAFLLGVIGLNGVFYAFITTVTENIGLFLVCLIFSIMCSLSYVLMCKLRLGENE